MFVADTELAQSPGVTVNTMKAMAAPAQIRVVVTALATIGDF
jgi:hypothetical protein